MRSIPPCEIKSTLPIVVCHTWSRHRVFKDKLRFVFNITTFMQTRCKTKSFERIRKTLLLVNFGTTFAAFALALASASTFAAIRETARTWEVRVVSELRLNPGNGAEQFYQVKVAPWVEGCRYHALFIVPALANSALIRQTANDAIAKGKRVTFAYSKDSDSVCTLDSIALTSESVIPGSTTDAAAGIGPIGGYRNRYATSYKSAYRDFGHGKFEERVDPITGKLTLLYTDLVIPGPNGMDIRIVRTYRSPDPNQVAATFVDSTAPQVYGFGWDLISGIGGIRNYVRLCPIVSGESPSGGPFDIETIPQWINERGEAEPFVPLTYGYTTKSGVTLNCGVNSPTATLLNGTTVTFTGDYLSGLTNINGDAGYHLLPKRVTDRWGNWIEYAYDEAYRDEINAGADITNFEGWHSQSFMPLVRITTSDSRTVDFEYGSMRPGWVAGSPIPNSDRMLTKIVYGTTPTRYEIKYEYQRIAIGQRFVGLMGKYLLTKVTTDDGLFWSYQYNDQIATVNMCSPPSGIGLLSRLTFPNGGTFDYLWGESARLGWKYDCLGLFGYQTFNTNQVRQKIASDGAVWRHSYTDSVSQLDPIPLQQDLGGVYVTSSNPAGYEAGRVTGPQNTEIFYHNPRYALYPRRLGDSGDALMAIPLPLTGRLVRHHTYNNATSLSTPVESRDYDYHISTSEIAMSYFDPMQENLGRATPVNGLFAWPKKTVTKRGSQSYIVDRAEYHLPCDQLVKVTETGQRSKRQEYDVGDFATGGYCQVIGEKLFEGTSLQSQIVRSLTPDRKNVANETNFGSAQTNGLTRSFTYFTTGDTASKTDARGYKAYFDDYFRGSPRVERYPVSASDANADVAQIAISRTVDVLGRIDSETDGETRKTSFTYNGQHKPTKVTLPRLDSTRIINFSYSSDADTVARGTKNETVGYDGFGRVTSYNDGVNTTTYRYDGAGRRVFVSYPGNARGQTVEYDALDRPTKLIEPDPSDANGVSTTTIAYNDNASTISITNPRGKETVLTMEAFGDPDAAWMKSRNSPEVGLMTFERNVFGQITKISHGGIDRTMKYDADRGYFLVEETHPELGTIKYGRDNNGNMITRQVGSSGVTSFQYDGQNRIVQVNPPAGSPSVTNTWWKTGLIKSSTAGGVSRSYVYDDNNNLTSESVTIDGTPRSLSYAYDALDSLESMTYPNGRQISFGPDLLGRPTKVVASTPGAIVTSASYWNHPGVCRAVCAAPR
jgi:YD repeat-containing protein